MKRFFLLLPLFFVASILYATPHFVAKKATITGVVKNANQKEINFMEYGLPFNFQADNKVTIHKNGHFKIDLELDEPQYYYMIYNKVAQLIYLEPQDDLHLEFDGHQMIKTLAFQGKAARKNEYLKKRFEYDRKTQSMVHHQGKRFGLYLLKWNDYKQQVDEHTAKIETVIKAEYPKVKRKDTRLKKFVNYEMANAIGTKALFYMQYPAHHAHFTRQSSIDFWEGIPLGEIEKIKNEDDKSRLMSKAYRDFLNQYSLALTEKKLLEKKTALSSKNEFIKRAYFDVDNQFAYKWQRDYVKTRILYEHINQSGVTLMKESFEDLKKQKVPASYISAVQKAWDKWALTEEGALAPEIVGQDTAGQVVKLSDFRGKVVYIDVWATWCGPCRQQIPFLKETEKRFHGKDVVFLSVSIDNNKKKWKEFVKKEKLTGVQIHNPGGWGSDICKKYNITGIPRFMLIDKEGKVVTVRAHRPSQGIDNMLKKHL